MVAGRVDGSIVFFEGMISGSSPSLLRRDDLTIRETQAVVDLASGDFDRDGNNDIVAATANSAYRNVRSIR